MNVDEIVALTPAANKTPRHDTARRGRVSSPYARGRTTGNLRTTRYRIGSISWQSPSSRATYIHLTSQLYPYRQIHVPTCTPLFLYCSCLLDSSLSFRFDLHIHPIAITFLPRSRITCFPFNLFVSSSPSNCLLIFFHFQPIFVTCLRYGISKFNAIVPYIDRTVANDDYNSL